MQNIFLLFDLDKSGTMSSYELRNALKASGNRNVQSYLGKKQKLTNL